MDKNEIAALRNKFAQQLRKHRSIRLNNTNTLQELISCTNNRAVLNWYAKFGKRLKDVEAQLDCSVLESFVIFDGKKFHFDFHISTPYGLRIVQYEVRYRLCARNFAEHFAFLFADVVGKLIEKITSGFVKNAEV